MYKLVHKQIYYIALSAYSIKCSYYIHALSFAHFGKLEIVLKISGSGAKNQFLMIFDTLSNNIFPVPGVG